MKFIIRDDIKKLKISDSEQEEEKVEKLNVNIQTTPRLTSPKNVQTTPRNVMTTETQMTPRILHSPKNTAPVPVQQLQQGIIKIHVPLQKYNSMSHVTKIHVPLRKSINNNNNRSSADLLKNVENVDLIHSYENVNLVVDDGGVDVEHEIEDVDVVPSSFGQSVVMSSSSSSSVDSVNSELERQERINQLKSEIGDFEELQIVQNLQNVHQQEVTVHDEQEKEKYLSYLKRFGIDLNCMPVTKVYIANDDDTNNVHHDVFTINDESNVHSENVSKTSDPHVQSSSPLNHLLSTESNVDVQDNSKNNDLRDKLKNFLQKREQIDGGSSGSVSPNSRSRVRDMVSDTDTMIAELRMMNKEIKEATVKAKSLNKRR
ncbi:hypothetical protein AKO1_015727 [Acrasis kona]|uniref:Uncharacterized protein n=1 Tax=Acrasis kona TaxID=1008807 RepID=A0AAW2ZGN2_9EUKA